MTTAAEASPSCATSFSGEAKLTKCIYLQVSDRKSTVVSRDGARNDTEATAKFSCQARPLTTFTWNVSSAANADATAIFDQVSATVP